MTVGFIAIDARVDRTGGVDDVATGQVKDRAAPWAALRGGAVRMRRVGWLTWGLAVALAVADLALLVMTRATPIPRGGAPRMVIAGWQVLLLMIFATMGALIVAHRPTNRIGWSFLAAGLGLAIQAFGTEYAIYTLRTDPGVLPGGRWLAWLRWISFPALTSALATLVLLFPTGRLLSPRWRPVAWLVIGWISLISVYNIFAQYEDHLGETPVRLTGGAARAVETAGLVGWLLNGLVVPAAVACLIVRFRRSRGEERQQLKWLAYAGAMLAAGALITPLVGFLDQAGVVHLAPSLGTLAAGLALLGLTGLPVAAGLAILRYRLYDIDRLINRTLVYGLLTALLVSLYAGAVLVLGQVFGGVTQDPPSWAVAGATLVVAALFQPARRRIQAVVDRRFNRRRYDAAQTVEGFSGRLRDEIDLSTLSAELLAVVDQTMQPTRASLWLRPPITLSQQPASREHG
jgi:hypothetical protein